MARVLGCRAGKGLGALAVMATLAGGCAGSGTTDSDAGNDASSGGSTGGSSAVTSTGGDSSVDVSSSSAAGSSAAASMAGSTGGSSAGTSSTMGASSSRASSSSTSGPSRVLARLGSAERTTGSPPRVVVGHDHRTCVAAGATVRCFSSSGAQLFSTDMASTLPELAGRTWEVLEMSISPDNGLLLPVAADGNTVGWVVSLTPAGQHRWTAPSLYGLDGGSLTEPRGVLPVAVGPDGTVFVSSHTGNSAIPPQGLSALDAADGHRLWFLNVTNDTSHRNVYANISAPQLDADGNVVVLTGMLKLDRVHPQSGVPLGRAGMDVPGLQPLHPRTLWLLTPQNLLLAVGDDQTAVYQEPGTANVHPYQSVYAWDAVTGDLMWTHVVAVEHVSAPVLGVDGRIFVAWGNYSDASVGGGGAEALSPNGETSWRWDAAFGDGLELALAADGTAYVLAQNNNEGGPLVHALRAQDGALQWSENLRCDTSMDRNSARAEMVVRGDGRVVAACERAGDGAQGGGAVVLDTLSPLLGSVWPAARGDGQHTARLQLGGASSSGSSSTSASASGSSSVSTGGPSSSGDGTWICAPLYRSDSDCDCGCGATDPACGGGGCTQPGQCNSPVCDYCYNAAGNPVSCS